MILQILTNENEQTSADYRWQTCQSVVAFTHLLSVFVDHTYYNPSKTGITMMLVSMFHHVETIDISSVH